LFDTNEGKILLQKRNQKQEQPPTGRVRGMRTKNQKLQ
jgi:hypothetical protein